MESGVNELRKEAQDTDACQMAHVERVEGWQRPVYPVMDWHREEISSRDREIVQALRTKA
jgi:hypothetical protein